MRWLCVAIVLLFTVPTAVLAEEETAPMSPAPFAPLEDVAESTPQAAGAGEGTISVTLQPLLWAFGYYSGNLEYVLTEKISFDAGMSLLALTTRTRTGSFTTSMTAYGIGVQPGIHYFLFGRAPEGLWLGPRLNLAYLSFATKFMNGFDSKTVVGGVIYGLSVLVGYTAVFGDGFTVTGGLGLGYAGASFKTRFDGTPAADSTGLGGSFGRVSLGFGWTF